MKVTREKIENNQAYLTVEMEPAEMTEPMEHAYEHLSQRASIPGFRKGKAPRAVLERYLSRERVVEEAIDHLLPQAYEAAVKEQDIKPYAQPQIEIVQADPVIFKAVVPLEPTVELGDYRSIRLAQESVPVTDENVNAVLEDLRRQSATWEPVERPLADNDMAVLDVNSEVADKPFIKKVGVQYQIIKDSVSPAPGFAGQLVGMKKGEEKEFKLKLPDDYAQSELAGKEASFKVKVSETKEEKLPALDDAFAQQVSAEYKTLDSLREMVSNSLKQRAVEQSRMNFEQKLIEALVEKSKVDYPPVLVEVETNRLLNEQARQLQMSGLDMKAYLDSLKKTEAQMREEMRPVAERNVTASLVMSRLAEAEKIEVGEADIKAEVDRMVATAADDKKDEVRKLLESPQMGDSINRRLLTQKTMDCLANIAGGTEEKPKEAKEEKKNE